MKKLLLILILIFLCYGCVRISKAQGLQIQDTVKYLAIEMDSTAELAQRDSVKRSKKSLIDTKLDTASVLPDIRKNMAVMKYQQKQLDSLLAKRKK